MPLIPRYKPLVDGATVFFHNVPTGNVILVDDILSELKDLRSQYLSDPDDKRRRVVENLINMIGPR